MFAMSLETQSSDSTTCLQCHSQLPKNQLRQHVGSHILHAWQGVPEELYTTVSGIRDPAIFLCAHIRCYRSTLQCHVVSVAMLHAQFISKRSVVHCMQSLTVRTGTLSQLELQLNPPHTAHVQTTQLPVNCAHQILKETHNQQSGNTISMSTYRLHTVTWLYRPA